MRKPKQRKPLNDLSRSLTPFDPNHTLIAVIEMSQKSWLVAGIIPGVERQPLKKLDADENELLKLLERWRTEAEKAGHKINRIAVAFEAGRDGFWLARWLRARGIEAHVIHAASVAVSREHRRAKTDRLDTEQLKRAFLGWLRGERDHCKMAAIPTFAEEDAKRPHRERETLVGEQTAIINRMKATLARLGIRSFNPKLKKAPSAWKTCARPRASRSRPTRSPNCAATWSAGGSSSSRSGRSRRRASSVSSRHPRPDQMLWSCFWRASSALASRRRTCWSGDLVTQLARPARRGALRGPHGLARRKRKQTPREGARPIRQRSGAAGNDPTRLALSRVPEGQRAGASGIEPAPRTPAARARR